MGMLHCRLATGNWTEAFIKVIDGYDPPHVGVVGPNHAGGNPTILTYDFVHRTHIDLFGFYYPRMFGDWSADWWITEVYQPNRSTKLDNVHLDHTMDLGQRYKNKALGSRLNPVQRFTLDRVTVNRFGHLFTYYRSFCLILKSFTSYFVKYPETKRSYSHNKAVKNKLLHRVKCGCRKIELHSYRIFVGLNPSVTVFI